MTIPSTIHHPRAQTIVEVFTQRSQKNNKKPHAKRHGKDNVKCDVKNVDAFLLRWPFSHLSTRELICSHISRSILKAPSHCSQHQF